MLRSRFAVLLLLSLFMVSPGHAQDSLSIASVRAYINDHGDAALTTGDLTIRYRTRASNVDGCALTVDEMQQSEVDDTHDVTTIDLSSLTPQVEVKTVDELSDVYSVRVETTSGENSLVTHREVHPKSGLDDDKDSRLDVRSLFTEIVFPSKESAERARDLMKSSIMHCGGAVRSAEVAARLKAEKDAQQALVDRLQKQCYRLIQNNLKSPSSAKFDADSPATIHKALDGSVLAFGTVDAENSFGGMLRKHYSCQFVLDNGSWLPKGEPLLF